MCYYLKNFLISAIIIAFPCFTVNANSIEEFSQEKEEHQQRELDPIEGCYYEDDIIGLDPIDGLDDLPLRKRRRRRELAELCVPDVEGDPHLRTWNGLKWDYHGECDLVAFRNPSFNNGKGIEAHIRTTRVHQYSYTSDVVVKVGNDKFEVHSGSDYSLNGIPGDFTNKTTDVMDGYQLSHWHSGSRDNLFLHRHYLKLGETGEGFDIKTFENMIYFNIHAGKSDIFQGSTGLFGDYDTGYLLGRDGVTHYEANDDFALEWQVRDTDEKLFTIDRAPMYPEKCLPPKKFVPRLGEQHALAQAEELCADWGDDKDNCVFDIIASKNTDLAQYKTMEAEAKAEALMY